MAEWKGHVFGGVDGQNISEYYLLNRSASKDYKRPAPEDFSSANLQASCELLGMDCLNLVFSHNDLGPTNIIVEDEPKSGKIGILDFEVAGYFPRSWIRTKFRISFGMYLSPDISDDPFWWAKEVPEALGDSGFDDVAEAWWKWRGYK
jgi:hypothetical protein